MEHRKILNRPVNVISNIWGFTDKQNYQYFTYNLLSLDYKSTKKSIKKIKTHGFIFWCCTVVGAPQMKFFKF